MADFETTRWKLAEDMDADDIKILMENKDKLNEEEKEAFANIIQENTPLSTTPLDDALENIEEDKEPPEEAKPAEVTPPVTTPQPPLFQTQEEIDAYLDKKHIEWDAEGKTKEEQKKEEKKAIKVFAEGEVPDDWNAAVNKFAPTLIEEAERRVFEKLDAREKLKADEQKKYNETAKKVYESFEKEFEGLASKKLIPDPKTSPEEYKKVHDAIFAIGDKRGSKNIAQAYQEYMQTPEEFGGGYKTGTKKAIIEKQKEAAGMVGSGRGAVTVSKGKTPVWADIHNKSMDDLLEARQQGN